MSNGFHFPLFVDLTGENVIVVGGGTIAMRRIGVLLDFGAAVTVIAPVLKADIESVKWMKRCYQEGDLEGAYLAIAATDQREVNRTVGEEAKRLGIPVSVADRREECTFYFPAVCVGTHVAAGIISHGVDHAETARAAKAVRKVLEDII